MSPREQNGKPWPRPRRSAGQVRPGVRRQASRPIQPQESAWSFGFRPDRTGEPGAADRPPGRLRACKAQRLSRLSAGFTRALNDDLAEINRIKDRPSRIEIEIGDRKSTRLNSS